MGTAGSRRGRLAFLVLVVLLSHHLRAQSGDELLSGFSAAERASIRGACYGAGLFGPARFYTCLNQKATELRQSPGEPDLAEFSRAERLSIRGACYGASLLYFSRATLEALAGPPFHNELSGAFARFQQALSPAMRCFLDRLPGVVRAKPAPGRKRPDRIVRKRVAQLLDASLHRRKVRMRYHSIASQRTKDYDVELDRTSEASSSHAQNCAASCNADAR